MLLLPFECLLMHSSLPPDALLQRLAAEVEPPRIFRWWFGNHKPYQGNVVGDAFSIRRVIHNRNSFLPRITGRVGPELGGGSVRIAMYPHPLAIGLLALWIAGGVMALALTLGHYLLAHSRTAASEPFDLTSLTTPAGILALGYGLALGVFKIESAKSTVFFQHVFQAHQVDDLGLRGLLGAA
jgi:hypothetical protein